jgi:cell division protein FtsW (lipid II flippase)
LPCIKIGREARDRFGISVCVGVTSMLFWQVALGLVMNVSVRRFAY